MKIIVRAQEEKERIKIISKHFLFIIQLYKYFFNKLWINQFLKTPKSMKSLKIQRIQFVFLFLRRKMFTLTFTIFDLQKIIFFINYPFELDYLFLKISC